MLDFWYSERCTREIKLITSIITCAIIYYSSTFEKLSPVLTICCLAIGMTIHLLRMLSLKIDASNPYSQGFKILFSIIPIAVILFIIMLLPQQNKIFTSVQAISFTALGLFIVSIYQNRAKRFQ